MHVFLLCNDRRGGLAAPGCQVMPQINGPSGGGLPDGPFRPSTFAVSAANAKSQLESALRTARVACSAISGCVGCDPAITSRAVNFKTDVGRNSVAGLWKCDVLVFYISRREMRQKTGARLGQTLAPWEQNARLKKMTGESKPELHIRARHKTGSLFGQELRK